LPARFRGVGFFNAVLVCPADGTFFDAALACSADGTFFDAALACSADRAFFGGFISSVFSILIPSLVGGRSRLLTDEAVFRCEGVDVHARHLSPVLDACQLDAAGPLDGTTGFQVCRSAHRGYADLCSPTTRIITDGCARPHE
jgi:hypothetical protein